MLLLSCPANDSRFREGDLVRISTGNPRDALAEATIVRNDDSAVEVQLWKAPPERLPVGTSGLQIDESFVDLEKAYLAAIDELGKCERGRTRILPLLQGEQVPRLDGMDFEREHSAARQNGFDDAQQEAAASALATNLCWLVHGPPGTGKTRVLAWIACQLVARGERVLVTALTHRAINHLLQAIADRLGDQRRIAKICPFPEAGFSLPQYLTFAECPLRDVADGYVIGATPFTARSRLKADFETCLIDEASQITLPLAAMAMLSAQRYIFAGDHKQLPPVTLTLDASTAAEMSIFKRLEGRGFDTLLPITHRLNDSLCEWPSASFYLSRLVPHPSAAPRRLELACVPSSWQTILGKEPSLVWLVVPHEERRTASPEEAQAVRELLSALRAGGVPSRDIGVVVPFRSQARLIRQLLAKSEDWDAPQIVLDTVERMQGQEREVVIVSFTTSEADFAMRLGSFLFQPQRLNVAATRARRKLILVASPALLDLARELGDDAAHFVSLLEQAQRVDLPAESVPFV
jgi:DNA replication ATP-dependent helicase Dna2